MVKYWKIFLISLILLLGFIWLRHNWQQSVLAGARPNYHVQGGRELALSMIAKRIEDFKIKNGKYPESLKAGLDQVDFNTLIPSENSFAGPIYYKVTSDGSFDLRFLGKDKIYGTADDIILKR